MSLLRTLHAWIGAALSLLLIVVGLTGALLVLKNDYLRLAIPAARSAPISDPIALGRAVDRLEAANPPAIVIGMEHMGMSGMPPVIQRLILPSRDLALFQAFYDHDGYGYADGQGRDVARWAGGARPETWLYNLHHFLLGGDKGMVVVGVEGLIATFLALTGLILWAPIARSFGWTFWPTSTKRGALLAAHRNLGVLVALPLVLFCLTGSGMIFNKPTQRLLTWLAPSPPAPEQTGPADAGDIDWPKALANAQAQYPKAELRMIVWPHTMFSPAVVRLRQPGEWSPLGGTEVWIDPENAQVIGGVDGLKQLGWGQRVFNAFYPLHTASFGGRLYDLFALVTGLAAGALGAYGLWSFVIKPRGRRKA